MREAFLQAGLQGVVLGTAVRGEQVDACINQRHWAPGSERRIGGGGGGSLVTSIESEQLITLRTGIGDLQHGVSAQLPLDAEVPLLHIGRDQARVHGEQRGSIGISQRGRRKTYENAGRTGYSTRLIADAGHGAIVSGGKQRRIG